jgi:spore maturation protein CgeB
VKYSVANPIGLEIVNINDTDQISISMDNKSPRDEVIKGLSDLVKEGKLEKAVDFSLKELQERKDMKDVYEIFLQYERERQFGAMTTLDKVGSFGKLLESRNVKENVYINPNLPPQILLLNWSYITCDFYTQTFKDMGFECTCVDMPKHNEEEFYEDLDKYLNEKKYDVVYSTDYWELVAKACYLHGVPYLAWTYDSPTFAARNKNLLYPTTNCFIFDSDDLRQYKEAGIKNAHFLSLAADVDYYDNIKCSSRDRKKYNSEISFVGNLYETDLPKAMEYLDDYRKAYIVSIMDNQFGVRGYDFFFEIIKESDFEWLGNPEFNWIINNSEVNKEKCEIKKSNVLRGGKLARLMDKQVTNKERLLVLALLSNHHEVKLYSDKINECFGNLKYCGHVDYYTQMPKVFKCSKINLNITMRGILNGIPLRCIDIMGCGGCLLTNYQKDFDEHFKDGENVIFYREAGEALEKAEYYLAHDSQREKIALSGYETVKKYYTYSVKIREMLELAGLQDLIKK